MYLGKRFAYCYDTGVCTRTFLEKAQKKKTVVIAYHTLITRKCQAHPLAAAAVFDEPVIIL